VNSSFIEKKSNRSDVEGAESKDSTFAAQLKVFVRV
jgi:hypothetical protein